MNMSMQLDLRHLQLLEAVADTGTLTRAAERLNVTQSALSHQLGDVERRLQTQLFLRVNRRLVLAPAGERLLLTARRVLEDLRGAEEDIARLSRNQAGAIRVSTECYTCYHWLTPLLRDFRVRYGHVEVEIVTEATRRTAEALLERQIDIGLVYRPVRDRRIRYTPLFHDEIVVVVPADHPFASRTFVNPGDLANETVILHSPPETSLFAQELTAAGVQPRKFSQVLLTEAILEMVRAGLGVSALPKWTLAAEQRNEVATVRYTRRGLRRPWAAATLKTNVVNDAHEHLIDLVRKRWAGPS